MKAARTSRAQDWVHTTVGRGRWGVLAGLLVGCDCPPMGAMVVEDRHGLATREQIDTIYATIADFADWTGVETVCSPGVRIRKASLISGGHTSLLGSMIVLDDSWLREADLAVRHELCHAWDISQGFPSLDHPDLFTGEGIEPRGLYPTDALRRMESFALACEKPPTWEGFSWALDEACDLGVVPADRRWLMDDVYRDFRRDWSYEGEIVLDLERVPLHGPHPLSVAVGDRRLLLMEPGGHWIDLVDPSTGGIMQRWPPPLDDPQDQRWGLLDGQPDPLLFWSDRERTRAWLVHEDGSQEEVAFITSSPVMEGLVVGRRAFVYVHTRGPTPALWEVDLDHGDAIEVRLWDGSGFGVEDIHTVGQDLLLLAERAAGWSLLRLDPGSGDYTERFLLPFPEAGEVLVEPEALIEIADGRLLLLLAVSLPDGSMFFQTTVLDPGTNGLRLDPAPCTGQVLQPPRRNASNWRFLWVDGEVTILDAHRGWLGLTRIRVP